MTGWFRRSLQGLLRRAGYEVNRVRTVSGYPPDFDAEETADLASVAPYSVTSPERMVCLLRAVRYLVANDIPGDLVECGVYRGGSVALMAKTLLRLNEQNRHLWLYDTFEGMTEPGPVDVSIFREPAREVWQREDYRCLAPLDEVRRLVLSTGLDESRIHFIAGRVEDTIPAQAPAQIALLRLDTDWYESTRHELVHLFPRLARGGVVIIDDYGHWEGARRATDEYLASNRIPLLLNRIDYTGRIGVKV